PRSLEPGRVSDDESTRNIGWAVVLLGLIIVQIGAGAFLAGLDAGMGYNTWPLMDGALVPDGLAIMRPAWKNLFENAMTVQFIHRTIAYGIVACLGAMLLQQRGAGGFAGVHGWLPRLGLLVLLQVILGISTLVMHVPTSLAVGHQALAFMLAGVTIAYIADMRRAGRAIP
ncbi:MAG: COX15/CtaA family protein, partial [Candidatus Devosia euplotis]|nr:COX15/CtaA family protein [Candidatus Devosia euplotis]